MTTHGHSCFGYLYLITEKSQAFEMFTNFQTEVERQLEKKIKIVRNSATDGLAEKRNRTLKDMVLSKISKTDLPTFLERGDQNNKL
ncbi:unnamed protein product [Prunus brigantina]